MLATVHDERNRLVHRSRQIHETAAIEKRDLHAEEQAEYNRLAGPYIDARGAKRPGEIENLDLEIERSRVSVRAVAERSAIEYEPIGINSAQYRSLYAKYLTRGKSKLEDWEFRALQTDGGVIGGYLVAPQQFTADVVLMISDKVFVRQLARVFPIAKAESLGAPSVDNAPPDSDWTTELKTGNEDSSITFGKRELKPNPTAKLVKASNTLLQRAGVAAESLVKERLAYKFAITQEKAFLTGIGSLQPLGVFTASNNGIDTSRDVTCSSTTAFTADDLITARFTLKAQYLDSPSVRWVFHRDGIRRIRQLKDANGQYLWRGGIAGDDADTILGVEYAMSEYAPNTFTTGLYVGLIGDFKHYWIADALTFSVQRLDELYAATNQVGLIGRMESDGMPALAEAFVRLKLA